MSDTFTENRVEEFFRCIEVWEIEPGLYEMREVGRGRKTIRYEKSRTRDLKAIRKQAYDIACVESDCRHEFPD